MADALRDPPRPGRRAHGVTSVRQQEADATAFPPLDAVRRWATALDDPERLVDPAMVELLRLTSRLPVGGSRVEVGKAARALVRETVERLHPAADAPWREQVAYRVLRTCFVEGVKAESAAVRLGVSVRQLSRERTRAIEVLRAELRTVLRELGEDEAAAEVPEHRYRFEPVPAIADFIARPDATREIADAVRTSRVVHVHGPAGIGKSSLVAELAAEWGATEPLLWYRVRTGVNDTLAAVLFELAEHLRTTDRPHLAQVVSASMPRIDVSVVSRLAVSELNGQAGYLVFDDYHLSEPDPAIGGFLDDIAARLPDLRIVTVGRHRDPRPAAATPIALPPLTQKETRSMLQKLGATTDERLASVVHEWTGGIPQLVQLASPWLATATPEEVTGGMVTLTERDEVQAFLLDWLTGLMDSYDRDILEAASIFRDQFTDSALAYVTHRTAGEVGDTSRRLVRYHVALRGREGDVAFVHTSIRDYVYERLPASRRRALHERAVSWYEERAEPTEAAYHASRAAESAAG